MSGIRSQSPHLPSLGWAEFFNVFMAQAAKIRPWFVGLSLLLVVVIRLVERVLIAIMERKRG
jgi:hypothetical protein